MGCPQVQNFTYDTLNRLTSANATGGSDGNYGTETYTYSATNGNLVNKAEIGLIYGAQDSSWPNAGISKAHAVVYAAVHIYCYDLNGNMTSDDQPSMFDPSYAYTYDAENRLTAVSGDATASFTYDGDGNRVKSTVGAITTAFIGDYFEWSNGAMTKYYYAGTTRIAMRTSTALKFIFSDHLGSSTVVYDVTAQQISRQFYKAWGEGRGSGSVPTQYTYTGQYSHVADFGLMFYKSRWYDSYLSRWVQPDSIIPDPYNPLDYDKYSYVRNNPINYNDPSGNCSGLPTDNNNPDIGCWNEYFRLSKLYQGITILLPGDWSLGELLKLGKAMDAIVTTGFGNNLSAFLKAFSGLKIWNNNNIGNLASGMVIPGIRLMILTDSILSGDLFGIVHEFGHAFDFQWDSTGYYYYSRGYANKFNKNSHCNWSTLGCLPDPSNYVTNYPWYLNIVGEGGAPLSPTNSWNPVAGYYRDYAKNSSIDDYADAFAALIVDPSRVSQERRDFVANNIKDFTK